ncbi:hypothetical protein BWQ96_02758 [Gracilariopsis chorda]|uniref:Uncharacterized protein n=1 Tax=Gracilariopsis chorda TaxID=448386 RepID=A0A2V3J0H6_9FLOR|nr:hypothetical protein BWQ96_02758 [Gracilariopsis chorda]|eukprot:PXF47427.1 hypothetical protein BWQ96_02758 [Gracilariopsis chorda]
MGLRNSKNTKKGSPKSKKRKGHKHSPSGPEAYIGTGLKRSNAMYDEYTVLETDQTKK